MDDECVACGKEIRWARVAKTGDLRAFRKVDPGKIRQGEGVYKLTESEVEEGELWAIWIPPRAARTGDETFARRHEYFCEDAPPNPVCGFDGPTGPCRNRVDAPGDRCHIKAHAG